MVGKYSIKGAGFDVLKTKLFKVDIPTPDLKDRTSYLGTPVYSNLEIKPFNYETLEGEQISILNGIIIDTVLISISQTKNIVTTPIQGRNGTVKEYVSDGDYQISIEGAIVSPTNNYPESEVAELIQICKAPISIPADSIVSEFLSWFGIHSFVIESFDFPQVEGVRNMQRFNISAISDDPIELQKDEF
jgi:hypothetical protein